MLLSLAQGFLVNMFVLFGFAALGSLLWIRAGQLHRAVPAWAEGLLYGVTAIVVMMVPACTSPGVLFDCRSPRAIRASPAAWTPSWRRSNAFRAPSARW
jgi:hypothetical protein